MAKTYEVICNRDFFLRSLHRKFFPKHGKIMFNFYLLRFSRNFQAHIERARARLPTRRVLTSGAARVNKKRVLVGEAETHVDEDVNADNLDFNRKILHTAWHPKQNIIALAATNRLYIFQDK